MTGPRLLLLAATVLVLVAGIEQKGRLGYVGWAVVCLVLLLLWPYVR